MATLATLRTRVRDQLVDHREHLPDARINLEINRAIDDSYPAWYTLVTYTFSGSDSTWEYSLPAGYKTITRVRQEMPDGTYVNLLQWDIKPSDTASGSTTVLVFNDHDHSGQDLVMEYLTTPSTLSTDTATTHVHSNYIVNYAAANLVNVLLMQETDEYIRQSLEYLRARFERDRETAIRDYSMRRPPTTRKMRKRPR